jgi:hypothetical protein
MACPAALNLDGITRDFGSIFARHDAEPTSGAGARHRSLKKV